MTGDARPSTPRPEVREGMRIADQNRGLWVPLMPTPPEKRSRQNYYKTRYPEYDFSIVRGVLHIRREAE